MWRLSGMIDWGRNGYDPEYMGYATAMNDGITLPCWLKVMKEVLKELKSSKQRLKCRGGGHVVANSLFVLCATSAGKGAREMDFSETASFESSLPGYPETLL